MLPSRTRSVAVSISVALCGIGASLHCFMACFMPDYMLKAQVPLPRNEKGMREREGDVEEGDTQNAT